MHTSAHPTGRSVSQSSIKLLRLLAAGSCLALVADLRSQQEVTARDAAGDGPSPTVQNVLSGAGSISGRVYDRETGGPLGGVSIVISGTIFRTGTDATGRFSLGAIPAGNYDVVYSKPGYLEASVIGVDIGADKSPMLDFAMVKGTGNAEEDIVMLESLSVTPEKLTQQMKTFEVRLQAEKMVNVFSLEDFGKFSAGDVADALVRISGVSVVKGQFAIIRGLEDRYSSVLYNSAPIPSPDPNSQSVQLDLFPSDVVSSLVVAKTFGGDLPGNSSGGSINIMTTDYSDDAGVGLWTIKLSAGTGLNTNARDRFIDFTPGSPFGAEKGSKSDVIESDFGVTLSGRKALGQDRFVYKLFAGQETDYDTLRGWQESREPRTSSLPRPNRPITPTHRSGDLSQGILTLSGGRYDLTESTRTEQTTGYLGLGYHFRTQGSHKLDATVFFTKKEEEGVQLQENGYLPNIDYTPFVPASDSDFQRASAFSGVATPSSAFQSNTRLNPGEGAGRGPLWFTNRGEGLSFSQTRDLLVVQLNGDHRSAQIKNLQVTWAINQATTTQEENALGAIYFYEPVNVDQAPVVFPTRPESLGEGAFVNNKGIVYSSNDLEERQNFGRLDANYSMDVSAAFSLKFQGGIHLEKASRDVVSGTLPTPNIVGTAPGVQGSGSQYTITGRTLDELGLLFPAALGLQNGRFANELVATSDSERLVKAFHFGVKASLWRKLDLLASFRRENVSIESRNDPYNKVDAQVPGQFGYPRIFPSKYLFFDRYDNPATGEGLAPTGTVFSDQLLGIDVPVDPVTGFVDISTPEVLNSLLNRKIDEKRFLPSLGLTWWATSRLSVRGGYSKTVARPSFREIGYYVSVQPGSSTLVVGNPHLKLSDVESWDTRIEYFFGDQGDLAAVSFFKKTIERPIESIILRDQADFEASGIQYRTFFNNQNDASLEGVELEGRKSLGFVGIDFMQYFSLGGNYTFIDAEVRRSQFELDRGAAYFATLSTDQAKFEGMRPYRRLYSQPEWIVNGDLSFNHPDWGTKATLAVFGISDVLDAAGSATGRSGNIYAFELDRYIASYNRIDFSFSQSWRKWTFKFSAKNLTDTERKVIYDPNQLVEEIAERSYKVGRDYSISASYAF